MRRFLTVFVFALACSGAADRDVTDRPATATEEGSGGDGALHLSEYGLGALRAGMTIAEGVTATNGALVTRAGSDTTSCDYLEWKGAPPGVHVMVVDGRIARIDVNSDSAPVSTAQGIRIGDPATRVREVYAGRISAMPHKYVDGEYLIVRPVAPEDSLHRLVFETDGARVTRFRGGVFPPVQYVEGCS